MAPAVGPRLLASPLLGRPDKATVGHGSRADELHAFVACGAAAEVVEEAVAPAQQDEVDPLGHSHYP
jgi:hypothetical protein